MKKLISFLILLSVYLPLLSQNIGQQGDTLLNYTDINGYKQGFWQKKYYSGKIKYEGYFKNDKPIGTFKRYYENQKLEAILKYDTNNDKAYAVLYNKRGHKIASGNYIDKKKDSIWKYFKKDTILLLEENYNHGVRQGLIRKYFENGNVFEETFIYNSIRDSTWKQYYSDGSLKMQCNHIKGVRTGDFVAYYPSGKLEVKGQYENDMKQGKWQFFKEDGSVEKEFHFKDDVADNEKEIHEKEQEYFKKLDKEKGEVADPENFINDPEKYMMKSKRF
ncbi:MAG: hypothetical protein GXO79_13955 [Chlorobi bacterium]|nr:hypothetical protein [Chlorobiota bacterium]